jgi:hypothetical protein
LAGCECACTVAAAWKQVQLPACLALGTSLQLGLCWDQRVEDSSAHVQNSSGCLVPDNMPDLSRMLVTFVRRAGWERFGLAYDLDEPLATALTPHAITGYKRLSRCSLTGSLSGRRQITVPTRRLFACSLACEWFVQQL